MPNSDMNLLLDSITPENINDALYFYSTILEKIVQKKKRYDHNEDILIKGLMQMNIKDEIRKLKYTDDTDSDKNEKVEEANTDSAVAEEASK